MRLHRFFIEEPIGTKRETLITSDALLHQWRKVFRFTPGNTIIIFDNSGYEYTASIEYINDKEAKLIITDEKKSSIEPKREIVLFASLVKKDTFEWILEKGTELGVSRFIPIISDRSEKKGLNVSRAEKIIIEASEQSGRSKIPQLDSIVKLEEALNEHSSLASVAFDPHGSHYDAEFRNAMMPLGVYIGPEGGWSPRELEMFSEKNIPILSVGEFTLRAETAALAILSTLLL